MKPQFDESCSHEHEKLAKQDYYHAQKEQSKFGKNEFEAVKQSQKLTVKEAFVPELKSSNLNKASKNSNQAKEQQQINASYKKFAVGAYVHLLNEDVKPPVTSTSTNNKTAPIKKEQEQKPTTTTAATKPSNSHKYFDDEDDDMVEVSKIKETTNGHESDTGSSSSSDSSDGLSEEQVIDDYYQKIKSSKKSSKRAKKMSVTIEAASNDQQVGQASINQNDLDKIASNVNATGKNKWKNSKQKQTNTSKHLEPLIVILGGHL